MDSGGKLGAFVHKIHLHLKQAIAFVSIATEILFGGSAGPGKSHLMRAAAIMWCMDIPGLNVYLFRRVEDDLRKNHVEGPHGFRNMLAELIAAKLVRMIDTEIQFWNGSRIFLCHCKDEKHRYKYHGAEIHVLMIDELTTFTEVIYRYLRFRVRMTGVVLPDRYKAGFIGPDGVTVNPHNLFPRILCSSNPGNIGHHWVKRMFGLDGAGLRQPTKMSDVEGGMVRQYIGALLSDNPSMDKDDPGYRSRMRGLGDPLLVKAMEEGDWNILAGGFFPEFRLDQHVLAQQPLPRLKFERRFRATDWGSARPFSTGWYAIADEDVEMEGIAGNVLYIPRGSLVRYREWYGAKPNMDNIGIKLPIDKWARGVLDRTLPHEDILYDVVDPSMFQENGGPSLAERAMKVKDKRGRSLKCRPADNRRTGAMGAGIGWDQVRMRLQGDDDDGCPTLFLMEGGSNAIRLMQSAQHDESKIEDIDTDQEDHALDEIRYACASRPKATPVKQKRKRVGPRYMTYDWVIQQGIAKPERRLIE